MHDGRGSYEAARTRSTTVLAIVAASLVVLALVIGRWLTTPFDDWVPLDAPAELPAGVVEDDLPAAAHFVCAEPLGAGEAPAVSDQAREAMTVQTLSREPCDGLRVQRRALGLVELLVIALAVVGTIAIWVRQGRAVTAPSVAST